MVKKRDGPLQAFKKKKKLNQKQNSEITFSVRRLDEKAILKTRKKSLFL